MARPTILCAALLVASCGLLPEPGVRVLTCRPEIAAYAERFNAQQNEFRVAVSWNESPRQALLDGEAADLLIGDGLASAEAIGRMEPLTDLVKAGRIDPAWFYPGLLGMGSRDNRPALVPLSFDLPAVVCARGALGQEAPGMLLSLEQMRTLSKSFRSQPREGGLATVGFSPLWEPEFLLLAARLFGARPRAGRGDALVWEEAGLAGSVAFTRGWVEENGGATADRAFAARVLVQPWERLLSARRVLFALVPFTEFIALPEQKRRDLEFRWLSHQNLVPVLENALFAGIPSTAANKRGARAFLEWFLSPATQRSMLELNRSLRIGVFGVTSGFLAQRALNEKELPQQHSLLLGHVPPAEVLSFPETPPASWEALRASVVLPWLDSAAAGQTSGSLEQAIAAWQAARQR